MNGEDIPQKTESGMPDYSRSQRSFTLLPMTTEGRIFSAHKDAQGTWSVIKPRLGGIPTEISVHDINYDALLELDPGIFIAITELVGKGGLCSGW